MVLTTGRQRTLKVSGLLGGVQRWRDGTNGTYDLSGNCIGGQAPLQASGTFAILAPWGAVVSVGQVPVGAGPGKDFGPQVTANNSIGSATAGNPTHVSPPYDYTNNYNGSYSMSIDVEECFDITTSDPKLLAKPDTPGYTVMHIFERTKIGGSASASISCGGASASKTDTIVSAIPISWYIVELIATVNAINMTNTMAASMAFEYAADMGYVSFAMTPLSYSKSDSTSSISGTEAGVTATASPPVAVRWCDYTSASAMIDSSPAPSKSYIASGVIKRLDKPYLGTFGLKIDRAQTDTAHSINALDGEFADTNVQNRHGGAFGSLNGGSQTPLAGLDEWGSVLAYARAGSVGDGDPYSLLALGEDQSLTRVMHRCWWRSPITLAHASGYTVDNCNSAAQEGSTGRWRSASANPYGFWQGDGDTVISAPTTGTLRFLSAGGGGSARRYFQLHADELATPPTKTPTIQLSSYRKLAIQIRAVNKSTGAPVDDVTLTLRIATRGYSEGIERVPRQEKTWSLLCRKAGETGTDGWVTRKIDLCSPNNLPVDTTEEGGAIKQTIILKEGPPQETLEETVHIDSWGAQELNADSRWPGPTLDAWMGGVTTLAFVLPAEFTGAGYSSQFGIAIEGLPTDVAVELDDVSLIRDKYATVTWCPAYRCWHRQERKEETDALWDDEAWFMDAEEPPDPPMRSRTHCERFLLGNVDGRQGLEEFHFARSYTMSVAYDTYTLTYSTLSVKDVLDNINIVQPISEVKWCDTDLDGHKDELCTTDLGAIRRNPGWTATELTASIDGRTLEDTNPSSISIGDWLNAYRPSVWLQGAGWRFTKETVNGHSESKASWKHGFDQDVTSTLTVNLQLLSDSVDWPPDAGDAFGFVNGKWGGAIKFALAAIYHGQAHGIVIKKNGNPRRAATVVMTQESNGARAGMGVSDRLGVYRTAIPYGKGEIKHKITLPPAFYLTTMVSARKRHRASFKADPPCQLFIPSPRYFPFSTQAGDQDILALEEWRRIPPASTRPKTRHMGLEPSTSMSVAVMRRYVEHMQNPAF